MLSTKLCFHCRFQRGLKRKHLTLIKKLRKAKKEASAGEKPDPVRTHVRNMIIVPEMIGSIVGVYNGKTFNQVQLASTSRQSSSAELADSIPALSRREQGAGKGETDSRYDAKTALSDLEAFTLCRQRDRGSC